MSDLIEVWGHLSQVPLRWGATLLDVGKPIKQYCSLSDNLRPAFIVKSETEPPKYTNFDAVRISKTQEANGRWVQVFELLDTGFIREFAILCGDMRSAIEDTTNEATAQSAQWQAFEDWLEFYKRSGSFSLEAARGLFGELMFMRQFLKRKLSWDEIISSWQGPLGSAQDFVLPGFEAFEIKTIQPSSSSVKIASEDQLSFKGPLILVVYRLLNNTTKVRGYTLAGLVQACLEEMNSGQAKQFQELLVKTGFSPDFEVASSIVFEAESPSFFDAGGYDFPKIVGKQLPPSISKVSYSISLAQIENFRSEGL